MIVKHSALCSDASDKDADNSCSSIKPSLVVAGDFGGYEQYALEHCGRTLQREAL